MPNPILPLWEYIPDGEPRVFGDRVYLYGSHDRAGSEDFCDFKLKVWSAPLSDLNNWVCHSDSFLTHDNEERKADVDWSERELYAPDCVEKDGKYYLYSYILCSKGCVSVSDKPEGPFKLISTYEYDENDAGDEGIYNDPGVLVDDDGRVYIYYGFERSYMNEIVSESMYKIKKGSLKYDVIPQGTAPDDFFEASSMRKIGDTYYLIYSGKKGNRLYYATSKSPTGPFERRGYIVDNGKNYPAGNNHGSIANINGQWYIFYHRMTNGTIMSRRACAERIEILPDGSIPEVEMTSLGFEESLNPYKITPAEIACHITGSGMITEKNSFERPVVDIKHGTVLGYKYFDFGEDFSMNTMTASVLVKGSGCKSKITVIADDPDSGEVLGEIPIGLSDGEYSGRIKKLNGRHAIFFRIDHAYHGWIKEVFEQRSLFDLLSFVFKK